MRPAAPTADVVGAAIVAACRETGDDPVEVVTLRWKEVRETSSSGRAFSSHSHFRARHYAYHALILEFKECAPKMLAGCVGARDCASFIQSTKYNVLDHGRYDVRPRAVWFDLGALTRVRSAIRRLIGLEDAVEQVGYRAEWDAGAGHYVSMVGAVSADAEEAHSAEKVACRFEVGHKFYHPTYGRGAVIKIRAWNSRRRDYPLVVEFDGGRSQTMYARVIGSLAQVRDGAAGPPVEETSIVVAVAKELVPIAQPQVRARVRTEWDHLTLRRSVATDVDDNTAEVLGDPTPGRSALARAEPWVPYEQRLRPDREFVEGK